MVSDEEVCILPFNLTMDIITGWTRCRKHRSDMVSPGTSHTCVVIISEWMTCSRVNIEQILDILGYPTFRYCPTNKNCCEQNLLMICYDF
jgi:hypothetical protein